MWRIPSSRKTSTMRSEPYCALLLRPMPAAHTSGAPDFVSSATSIPPCSACSTQHVQCVQKVPVVQNQIPLLHLPRRGGDKRGGWNVLSHVLIHRSRRSSVSTESRTPSS